MERAGPTFPSAGIAMILLPAYTRTLQSQSTFATPATPSLQRSDMGSCSKKLTFLGIFWVRKVYFGGVSLFEAFKWPFWGYLSPSLWCKTGFGWCKRLMDTAGLSGVFASSGSLSQVSLRLRNPGFRNRKPRGFINRHPPFPTPQTPPSRSLKALPSSLYGNVKVCMLHGEICRGKSWGAGWGGLGDCPGYNPEGQRHTN